MNMAAYGGIAAILYLLAAGCWAFIAFRPEAGARVLQRRGFFVLAVAAVAIHALVLEQLLVTGGGLNLGFFNALSLVGWVIALLIVAASTIRPVENLALVFFPAAALFLVLEHAFPSARLVSDSAPAGLKWHIILSIGAYATLTIAAVQSLVLAAQEQLLHSKRPVQAMRVLPPLQVMEELLVQLIAVGFFLLSLGVVAGLMFVRDVLDQHLAHKIVFSVLGWLIFAGVLAGRWKRGWRGRQLVHWTLGGFAALLLAYFGSKLVLELILHRV